MASKDTTSLARTTKRIGSLRFFIRHKGTTKKNFGKATPAQLKKWKTQLAEEEKLREKLQGAAKVAREKTPAA